MATKAIFLIFFSHKLADCHTKEDSASPIYKSDYLDFYDVPKPESLYLGETSDNGKCYKSDVQNYGDD